MSAPTRVIARISAALGVLLLIVTGTAANAQVPPPDPTTVGAPTSPPPPATLSSGVSFTQELGWMLAGAAVVLAAATIWYALAALSRRHHTPALRAS